MIKLQRQEQRYTAVISRFIQWMQTKRQVAANPETKPTDLGCEFTCRLLPSTPTIAIYYYCYSVQRPEIKQSLTGWCDNCGSESSTLETDVCVWRYAPLVVHATQEEEEEGVQRMTVILTFHAG